MKLIFFMQISIKLSYKFIPLTLVGVARPTKLPRITSLQNLCDIIRTKWGIKLFFCAMSITIFYKWNYNFWWVWRGMLKLLKITIIECLCNISRTNWVMKLIFYMLITIKFFYNLIVLFLMSLARDAQSTRVNQQWLCNILKKK